MTVGQLMTLLVTGPPEAEVQFEGTPIHSVEFGLWRDVLGQERTVVTLRERHDHDPDLTPGTA